MLTPLPLLFTTGQGERPHYFSRANGGQTDSIAVYAAVRDSTIDESTAVTASTATAAAAALPTTVVSITTAITAVAAASAPATTTAAVSPAAVTKFKRPKQSIRFVESAAFIAAVLCDAAASTTTADAGAGLHSEFVFVKRSLLPTVLSTKHVVSK